MKIKTRGAQAFNVPDTEEGHLFFQLLRKFKNRRWHYRARGRGSRKEHGNQYSLPQEHAEWLAIYMSPGEGQYLPNIAPQRRGLTNEFRVADRAAERILCGCDDAAGFRCGVHNQVPVFHPPAQIMEARIAEWSSPFIEGSPVAISPDGMVYNSAPHGLHPGTSNIGFAVAPSEGAIGEGEGIVHVQLTPLNVAPPGEPIPWPQAEPMAENEVELTPNEQGMMETILRKLLETEVQFWPEEDVETFENLFDKLVD